MQSDLFIVIIVSTGLRFTTLPDATPPSSSSSTHPSTPTQPPTTLTAIFNPMMGHLSTAYAARVSRDLSLCSRFDFNLYSYESEWTMGAEWWIRRAARRSLNPSSNAVQAPSAIGTSSSVPLPPQIDESDVVGDATTEVVQGVVKARMSTNTVRNFLLLFWMLNSMFYPLRRTLHRMCPSCGKDELARPSLV